STTAHAQLVTNPNPIANPTVNAGQKVTAIIFTDGKTHSGSIVNNGNDASATISAAHGAGILLGASTIGTAAATANISNAGTIEAAAANLTLRDGAAHLLRVRTLEIKIIFMVRRLPARFARLLLRHAKKDGRLEP
ncbi:MAG TPA: hypothetical protein VEJ16_07090, partial [Alphaproteobacteria bacterium]|nr:hypothetical protein [Alphaproteobacteria bacterium]